MMSDKFLKCGFVLTPLGAAIVEALPDRKKMSRIKSCFKKTGKCPTSAIFPTQAKVRSFYSIREAAEAAKEGEKVNTSDLSAFDDITKRMVKEGMFNDEQVGHMRDLSLLSPNEKCQCGWYRKGECPHQGCIEAAETAKKEVG